ncbi:MAG: helix-turn-helix domain-containing protein [Nanoarchaeota archaeon]|nr:helix-turn-helix domain-containing protein [Nanoarchaeota archaeon]
MDEITLLKSLGFTESESKVYLALLKIGGFVSKGAILKETRTAPSKVYFVLQKLIDKGLVSTIVKNNVKQFKASPPSRIKDYIALKKSELAKEEETANKLLPKLESLSSSLKEPTTAEIFFGWKGMQTAYDTIIGKTEKGQTIYVLGANKGSNPEKTTRFFSKYGLKVVEKGIHIKIIYDENSRNYARSVEQQSKVKFDKRFLFKTAPTEVAFTKGITAIVMLKEEPIVILVKDKETSQGFLTYFNELWNIAKN